MVRSPAALRRALSPDFSAGALAVFIPWRVGAEESGAVKLLDLRGPPGRCSGCWPHDGEVAGGSTSCSLSRFFGWCARGLYPLARGCRRIWRGEVARPARAAWAVQRLLAARW